MLFIREEKLHTLSCEPAAVCSVSLPHWHTDTLWYTGYLGGKFMLHSYYLTCCTCFAEIHTQHGLLKPTAFCILPGMFYVYCTSLYCHSKIKIFSIDSHLQHGKNPPPHGVSPFDLMPFIYFILLGYYIKVLLCMLTNRRSLYRFSFNFWKQRMMVV